MANDPEDEDEEGSGEEGAGDGDGEEGEEDADAEGDADEDADAEDDAEENEEEDAEDDADADEDSGEDADADDDADAEGNADAEDDDADEDEDSGENEDEDSEENEDEDSEEDADGTEAAAEEDDGLVELPDVDEDVFGSAEEWDAEPEDFEDDAGDWTPDDYHEVATTLFGDHEFFGDTAEQRYVAEGFVPLNDQHPYVRNIVHRMPQGATIDFYEKDGRIVPRGFLTSAMLALLESSFPDLVLEMLHVTVPRRPRPVPGNVTDMTDDNGATLPPPRQLPDALKSLDPADAVDLRKYASPVGDQGSTSRCAAFAWTHALEMLGNIQQKPLPRLACSFTMVRFQQRQGDFKDFKYAWKGGDGTEGTWEPGHHLFTNGTCRHDLWNNDQKEPSASIEELEADAQKYRVDADVYDVSVDDMKRCLTAGLPVQISMATGDAFQDIGRDGVMKVAEAPKGQHGYHAMLCVGYVGNYFIVKNSWGDDWGDKGYCYIPKKVLMESEPEAVAIVPRKPLPPGAPAPAAPPPPGIPTPFASSAAARPAQPPFAPPPQAFAPPQPVAQPPARAPLPPPRVPAPAPAPALPLIACARCAKPTPHGKFCSDCGSPLPPPAPPQAPAAARRFCENCGTPREGAGRFCATCGAPHRA